MDVELKYQLRLTLSDPFAKVARNHPDDPSIAPLTQVLHRHEAALKCQYDAFADYVREAEANGVGKFPLYAWTKKTVDDPVKEASTPNPSHSMSGVTRSTTGVRPTPSRPSSNRWSEVQSWRRCSDTIPIQLTIRSRGGDPERQTIFIWLACQFLHAPLALFCLSRRDEAARPSRSARHLVVLRHASRNAAGRDLQWSAQLLAPKLGRNRSSRASARSSAV
jgi:hypothetical protein